VLLEAGATIRFDADPQGADRPGGFNGRTMEVVVSTAGRDQSAQAGAIVRAAALAEAVQAGRVEVTPARIRELDREAHVSA
ncbi:hypothetical protein, partial [Saezia sanguinis]